MSGIPDSIVIADQREALAALAAERDALLANGEIAAEKLAQWDGIYQQLMDKYDALAAKLAEAEGRLVATDALIDALRFSSREAESEAIELSKRLARVEDAFTRWFGECGCGGETCPTCNVERAMQSETVTGSEP